MICIGGGEQTTAFHNVLVFLFLHYKYEGACRYFIHFDMYTVIIYDYISLHKMICIYGPVVFHILLCLFINFINKRAGGNLSLNATPRM